MVYQRGQHRALRLRYGLQRDGLSKAVRIEPSQARDRQVMTKKLYVICSGQILRRSKWRDRGNWGGRSKWKQMGSDQNSGQPSVRRVQRLNEILL